MVGLRPRVDSRHCAKAWKTKPTWFTLSHFDGESGAKTTGTHQSTCLGPISYYRWKNMSNLLHLNSEKRKEGELSNSSLQPSFSPIPHNLLLLALLPLLIPFPQAGLLLIDPSTPHGKTLILFFPRLNTQEDRRSPEKPPGGGDKRLPITQPAERQWEAETGNHHFSQFTSLEPPWLPAHVLCFAGAWEAANPRHRSWRKDFPFIPAGSFWQKKGQGIITGQ